MDANVVTQEAGNRIQGAKLRNSFVASLHTLGACENLQRQFDGIALALGETAPDVLKFVRFTNHLADQKFQEYLTADREARATRNVLACLAEERDGAAAEVAAVLAPAKRASDELLPRNALKPWLHGPVERTPTALHRQAEEVSFWIHEAGGDLGQPVLQGIRFEPDEIVAEIERHTQKLGGALGSLDEVAGHLEAARFRARKAGEASDQCYLQVKATLEAVCHLGDASTAVRKYGPPSLRKLNRSKKRKKQGVVEEQVAEAAVPESDSLAASPALGVEESDLQNATRALIAEESDLQNATHALVAKESDLQDATRAPSVEESDLQNGTRSTAVCRDSSALTDGSRRKKRRDLAVTSGGGGHGGRFSAVTGGVRGSRRGRLSVTKGACGPRGSRSEVTDAVRSPENRGRALREGVTARIRRFFALS